MVQYYSERMVCYFNPRSPHGERRRGWCCGCCSPCNFNPRSPHGERPPAKFPASTCTEDFNPRSPHGERPVAVWTIEPQDEHFNPRSPHGERPRCLLHGHRARAISIHAPRTGSDVPAAVILADIRLFQSTLPARGATSARNQRTPTGAISIHAPRTGSDRLFARSDAGLDISIHAPRTGSDTATPTK